MAQAYKFYKIGEANAEIARLESELTKANARASELEGAAGGNEAELAKQLTEKDSEIKTISANLEAEKKAHAEAKAALEKANAEVAALPEKVKTEAAKESQRILASLGHDPLKVDPATNAGGQSTATTLTGIERTRAAFQAQFEKHNPK